MVNKIDKVLSLSKLIFQRGRQTNNMVFIVLFNDVSLVLRVWPSTY